MTTQVAERREDLHRAIDVLPESAMDRLTHFIRFLQYEEWLEEQEDLEDVAYLKSHRGEPAVSFSEVVGDYETKHGPLD